MSWLNYLSPFFWKDVRKAYNEARRERGDYNPLDYGESLANTFGFLENAQVKLESSQNVEALEYTNNAIRSLASLVDRMATDCANANDMITLTLQKNGKLGKQVAYALSMHFQTARIINIFKSRELDMNKKLHESFRPFIETWNKTIEANGKILEECQRTLGNYSDVLNEILSKYEENSGKIAAIEDGLAACQDGISSLESYVIGNYPTSDDFEKLRDELEDCVSGNEFFEHWTVIRKEIGKLNKFVGSLRDELHNYATNESLEDTHIKMATKLNHIESSDSRARKRFIKAETRKLKRETREQGERQREERRKAVLDSLEMSEDTEIFRYRLGVNDDDTVYVPYLLRLLGISIK